MRSSSTPIGSAVRERVSTALAAARPAASPVDWSGSGEGQKASAIRTGLLPAFATFEAKGKEGGVDLGVHFGFAPQINNAGGVHDNFGNGTQAGAQIDMRQVYLTAGGTWGQLLAGREIGLYQRNNILNDMTLFGVGASGGGRLRWWRRNDARPHRLRLRLSELRCANDVQQPRRRAPRSLDRSLRSERDRRRERLHATKIPRVGVRVHLDGPLRCDDGEAPAGTDKVMIFASGEWQHASTAFDEVSIQGFVRRRRRRARGLQRTFAGRLGLLW